MAGGGDVEVVVDMAAQAAAASKEEAAAAKSRGSGGGKIERVALPLGMVLVQVFTIVSMLLSKLALNTGMHPFALLVYRNLIGAAVVAPLAVIFERDMRKKVNHVVLGWISINGTFGVLLATGLYYYGLRATNATYSVCFLNIIPVVTFVIAIALRADTLMLRNWTGKMKVVGTAMGVGGTMVVSLCKGKLLHLWPTHLLRPSHHAPAPAASLHRDMIAGTLFLCGSCLSYALWFIVQFRVAKLFPSKYWATALTCLSGSLQSVVVGLVITTDRSAWKLKWDLQLLTVVYSGVFNTGLTFVLISWAIARRGPIYPPMFNSLSLIITTVMDSLLLGTNIYLGSVLGTMLIILGLYAFLWGKGKELATAAACRQKQGTATADDGEEECRCSGVEMRMA